MQTRQIQPKNLNAQTVDRLGQQIVRGHYKEGQQLPIEPQLCIEFGVSRPIVREATKILIAKGLLNSKPKIGTIVQNRNRWNLLDPDVLNWVTQSLPASEFLNMLFEARMAIEPTAAALAAEKATEDDIERIAIAYQDMAAAQTIADSIEPDIRFHQAVLDATHNEVIRYIGHTLHNALAISISLTSWHEEIHALSLPRHEAVYLAIAEKNPQKADKAVRNLLADSRRDFDKKTSPR
jgi:DNA-binding FadR family transcriptional regulator